MPLHFGIFIQKVHSNKMISFLIVQHLIQIRIYTDLPFGGMCCQEKFLFPDILPCLSLCLANAIKCFNLFTILFPSTKLLNLCHENIRPNLQNLCHENTRPNLQDITNKEIQTSFCYDPCNRDAMAWSGRRSIVRPSHALSYTPTGCHRRRRSQYHDPPRPTSLRVPSPCSCCGAPSTLPAQGARR